MAGNSWNGVFKYDCLKAANDVEYANTAIPKTPCFVAYTHDFQGLVGNDAKIELLKQQDEKFAHEAGIYIAKTKTNVFTSNYQSGKKVDIHEVDCSDSSGKVTIDSVRLASFPQDEIIYANGGCNYNGNLLFCAQGSFNHPSAMTEIDPQTHKVRHLLTNYLGRPFNSVNDVVIHHETGDIWFTDPTYGYEQAFRPSPRLPSQVYRFRPSTGQVSCVADQFTQCNGLCFSPDYEKMYITDTGAIQAHATPGDGHNFSFNPRLPASIYEYDVVDEGTRLANRRTFAFCDVGVPDGIKCDTEGNVWSGTGSGVDCWNKRGELIGKIHVGGTVANFNFSPVGIFMMAEERLMLAKVAAKGALGRAEGWA